MKTLKNRLFVLLAGLFMVSSAMTVYAVEFKVTVPAGTKECYVAGTPNWNFVKMQGSGTSFHLSTTELNGQEFKYSSGPDWQYEEQTADGQYKANRTTIGNPDVVAKWKEIYNPGPPAPVVEPQNLVISVYKEGSPEQKTKFVKVPGTTTYEYEAKVSIVGYTGNPNDYKYWIGANNAWENGKSCNFKLGSKNSTETGCNGDAGAYAGDNYLASCASGIFSIRIYSLADGGKEQNAPNYYAHGLKQEDPQILLLTSSLPCIQSSEPIDKITLSVTELESGKLEGNYTWYQSTNKVDWVQIGTPSSNPSLILQGSTLPEFTTYYQVRRKEKGSSKIAKSNIRPIVVIQACGPNTKGKQIYKEDFGQLNGIKDRSSFPGMSTNYKYRPYPKKINDGQYALIATPYYCGCGEGGGDKGEESVETCEGNNMWFRQFLSDGFTPMRDHTLNNLTDAGPYGAMLMINYAKDGDKVAYQHVLTAEEKAQFSPSSILRFSAWFASAAKKEATAVLVNMALKIEFKAYGTSNWVEKASIVTKVGYNDDWMRGEAELVLDKVQGDYRITIENYAGGGEGNDVLIDDISVDLCVPSFGLYFYEDGQDKADVVLDKLDQTIPVRVENMDFGSIGANPCMMLFRYNENAAQKYTYVGDMILDPVGKYYVFNVSANELSPLPGTTQFQAVASASPCSETIKNKVQDGTYKPGAQDDAIFSGNQANMTVNCGTSSLSLVGATKVCQNNTLPNVQLQSTFVGTSATYTVMVNNQVAPTLQNKSFSTTTTTIDMNALPADMKTVGTKNITVEVKEMYNRQVICTRTTNAVSFSIEPRPSYNEAAFVLPHTLCQGETAVLQVEAQNAAKYQWQLQKSPTGAWENVGTNQASYTTPTNAQDGWKYQVVMTNTNATNCTATTKTTELNVEVCDNLSLQQSVDKMQVCPEDQVMYQVVLKNNSLSAANNVRVQLAWNTSYLRYEQYSAAGQLNVEQQTWDLVREIPAGETKVLKIYFKLTQALAPGSNLVVSSYVSSLGSQTWGSFERQSTTMRGASTLTPLPIAPLPVAKVLPLGYSYDGCVGSGDVLYNDLLEAPAEKSYMKWSTADLAPITSASFSTATATQQQVKVYNAAPNYCPSQAIDVKYRVKPVTTGVVVDSYNACKTAQPEILNVTDLIQNVDQYAQYVVTDNNLAAAPSSFDKSVPMNESYIVRAMKANECMSDPVAFTVRIKDNSNMTQFTATEAQICPGTQATLTAQTSLLNPVFKWYDASNQLVMTGNQFLTPILTENTTYKVTVQNSDWCETPLDQTHEPMVAMKPHIQSLSLEPAEESLIIGTTVQKNLVIVPADAPATITWFVDGKEVSSIEDVPTFKPYANTEYKVVATTECNTQQAVATVKVDWPTVFTPYTVDGFNDDFITNMDPQLPVTIFDRYGNKIAQTSNGWDGLTKDGKMAMPGVYYYVVELPNGEVHKGSIEIYND